MSEESERVQRRGPREEEEEEKKRGSDLRSLSIYIYIYIEDTLDTCCFFISTASSAELQVLVPENTYTILRR